MIVSAVARSAIVSGAASGPDRQAPSKPDFIDHDLRRRRDLTAKPCVDPSARYRGELEGAGIQVDERRQSSTRKPTSTRPRPTPSDPTNPSRCSTGSPTARSTPAGAADLHRDARPPRRPTTTSPRLIGTAAGQRDRARSTPNAGCSGAPVGPAAPPRSPEPASRCRSPTTRPPTFYATASLAGFVLDLLDLLDHLPGGHARRRPGGETPGGGTAGRRNPRRRAGGRQRRPGVNKVPDPGQAAGADAAHIPGYAANDNTPTVTGKAPGAGQGRDLRQRRLQGPGARRRLGRAVHRRRPRRPGRQRHRRRPSTASRSTAAATARSAAPNRPSTSRTRPRPTPGSPAGRPRRPANARSSSASPTSPATPPPPSSASSTAASGEPARRRCSCKRLGLPPPRAQGQGGRRRRQRGAGHGEAPLPGRPRLLEQMPRGRWSLGCGLSRSSAA